MALFVRLNVLRLELDNLRETAAGVLLPVALRGRRRFGIRGRSRRLPHRFEICLYGIANFERGFEFRPAAYDAPRVGAYYFCGLVVVEGWFVLLLGG